MTAEVDSDPFLPLVLAAEHTQRIELMTSIAVAFARNPMTVAQIGNDLQAYLEGALHPGPRLPDQAAHHEALRHALVAIPRRACGSSCSRCGRSGDCWYKDEKLEFRGDHYTHTLMTPMFTPKNNPYGPPRVVLAAVGPKMTEVVGEVADGMLVHAFTTARYLREVTHPALLRGLARSARARTDVEVCYPAFIVTGRDEQEWEAMRIATARQIGFYGSTPAYRGVLEVHGWGDLQGELNRLSKRGEWQAMGEQISDDVLEEFAIVAEPAKVASALKARFGGLVDRVLCSFSFVDAKQRADYLEELRAG